MFERSEYYHFTFSLPGSFAIKIRTGIFHRAVILIAFFVLVTLSRLNFAIIIATGIHLQKGKMMAITIRDTQKHERMLSKLKQQTGETTLSKALLRGGYDAIRYRELCASQQEQIDELRSQLYKHHKSISCFFDALNGLKDTIEKGA